MYARLPKLFLEPTKYIDSMSWPEFNLSHIDTCHFITVQYMTSHCCYMVANTANLNMANTKTTPQYKTKIYQGPLHETNPNNAILYGKNHGKSHKI